MKNLRYHFPTCYAYSVKEPIGELNLKRALDKDTGVFSSFFSLLSSSSPLGQTACFSNVDVACKKVSNNYIYLGVWCFKLSFIRAPTTTIGSKKRLNVQSGVTNASRVAGMIAISCHLCHDNHPHNCCGRERSRFTSTSTCLNHDLVKHAGIMTINLFI